MNAIMGHAQFVRGAVEHLDETCTFGFAAAMCQRIFPIVVDRLEATAPKRLALLEDTWRGIWKYLCGLNDYPANASAIFEEQIPMEVDAGKDNALFQVTTRLYGLTAAIESHSPGDVPYLSDHALAMVDNFLYTQLQGDVSPSNDLWVDSHPLVTQEIERQRRDLRLCAEIRPSERAVWELWQLSSAEVLLS